MSAKLPLLGIRNRLLGYELDALENHIWRLGTENHPFFGALVTLIEITRPGIGWHSGKPEEDAVATYIWAHLCRPCGSTGKVGDISKCFYCGGSGLNKTDLELNPDLYLHELDVDVPESEDEDRWEEW